MLIFHAAGELDVGASYAEVLTADASLEMGVERPTSLMTRTLNGPTAPQPLVAKLQ